MKIITSFCRDKVNLSNNKDEPRRHLLYDLLETDTGLISFPYLKELERKTIKHWMFDCGAFTYIDDWESNPAWDLEYCYLKYHEFAKPGDYVVSPDAPFILSDSIYTRHEKEHRMYRAAESFKHAAHYRHLIPIAVVHGDIETRLRMLHTYLDMGYTYIGIGGLVQYLKSGSAIRHEYVKRIIESIVKEREKRPFLIHTFGIGRFSWLRYLTDLKIDSTDSSFPYSQGLNGMMVYDVGGRGVILDHEDKPKPWCDCVAHLYAAIYKYDINKFGNANGNKLRCLHNMIHWLSVAKRMTAFDFQERINFNESAKV